MRKHQSGRTRNTSRTQRNTRVRKFVVPGARRAQELNEQVAQLEDTRRAMSNLLEDFHQEQRALSEAKAMDEALLESIGDGVIATDQEGRVTVMNRVAEGLTGFAARDILGKDFGRVISLQDVHGNPIPNAQQPIAVALAARKIPPTTYSLVRKDGTIFSVAIAVAPVLLNAKASGAIVVFRDITKEKAVDRAKSEFIALAAHQLRTPLTVINWYVELLMAEGAEALTTKQRGHLDEVVKGSGRMVRLINDLLNLSRLETGQLTIEPVPTDLVTLIRSINDDVRKFAGTRRCVLRIEEPTPPLPKIPVDPSLMRQVLSNVIGNAIKYSCGDNECTVVISLRATRGSGADVRRRSAVEIRVSDHGIGIPQDVQPRIFEKMFRADNARALDSEGSGLGLYIAKLILHASGGTIGFSSEEGKGTTFVVSIPMTGMKSRTGEKTLAV